MASLIFHVDPQTGIAPYLQIIQQVKHALRVGLLKQGDQLPTVREAVEQLAIHPNTILKAYRELEIEGIVGGRPGQGTFVLHETNPIDPRELASIRLGLEHWIQGARAAGFDDEGIRALVAATLQAHQQEESA
jgi:GntR family transcriptional regulator